MTEKIQNMFFGKETISNLNKILLQQPKLQNLTRENKQELVNILIKNMKMVYKSMDTSKINNTNFTSIFDQFKKYSISETLEEYNKKNSQVSTDIKFQRDFNSYPTTGNKMMERPSSSKSTPSNLNQKVQIIEKKRQEQKKMDNPFANFESNMLNQESSLDDAFKPMINDLENSFNNYTSGRTGDIDSKMSELQQIRQMDEGGRTKRPTTPDFLKSKKTNPDKVSETNNAIRETSRESSNNKGGKVDFTNVKSSEFNNSFNGLANDIGGDLFSLDNIDKPLIDMEIPEDTASFDERLKRLTSERDNMKSNVAQQGSIDFTSENFVKSDNMNSNAIPSKNQYEENSPYESSAEQSPINKNQQIQTRNQQQNQQHIMKEQMIKEQMMKEHMIKEQMMKEQMMKEQIRKQIMKEQIMKEQIMKEQIMKEQIMKEQIMKEQIMKEPTLSITKQIEEKRMKAKQIEMQIQEHERREIEQQKLIQQKMQQKMQQKKIEETQKIQKAEIEQKHKRQLTPQQLQQLQKRRLQKQLQEIEELERLQREKPKKIVSEMEVYEPTRVNDLLRENNELKMYIERIKKEKEIELLKPQYIQMEVTNLENKSSYVWKLQEPLNNVTGIKLISYSIPETKFNIEENKNNILKFNINNKEIKINIATGKYTIEELINIINSKSDIKLSLTNEQKIKMEYENEFDIISTYLSKENFGFLKDNSNSNNYISDRAWDLRIDNKVYLYLNNLSDTIPFGILRCNSDSISEFKFQEPYNLDKLNIYFKDSRGFDYNFYNLSHNLSFLIEKNY
jgi:hypothetical protein